MSFLETIDESAAQEKVAEQYEEEKSSRGYLPNYVQTFSLRPEVYEAWGSLITTIKRNMDLRRYELVTLAAAQALESSYCSLAHGKILLDKFLDESALLDLVVRPSENDVDRAVMDLAGKVARDAPSVTEADIERMRRVGLTDQEIFDVIAAAAARAFFTKVLDGTGTRPDREYRNLLGDHLVDALAVGRPVDSGV
jgi:uncharacterized peroxidase-related enzyme